MLIREVAGLFALFLLFSGVSQATDIQGVVTDWKCTESMVRNGRERVLKQDRNCSLAKNPNRDEYGIITDGKKFYHLDEEGNKKIRLLLHDSPNKDTLRVIVTGTLDGNLIKVTYASIL